MLRQVSDELQENLLLEQFENCCVIHFFGSGIFFWCLERCKLHLFIFRNGSYISLHCLPCLFFDKPTYTTQFVWIHNETIFSLCIFLRLLFLTPKKEHRLKVFESRLLKNIFGPKEEEVKGDRIKLFKEELHGFYYSLNIMSRLRIICI